MTNPAPETTAVPTSSASQNWSALWSLLGVAVPVLIGVGLAMAFQATVLMPKLGLGQLERTISVGQLLSKPLPAQSIVLLGNSVTREGIDAGQISTLLNAADQGVTPTPPWQAYNCALSGCAINEQLLMLPQLLSARPIAVVIPITAAELGLIEELNIDKSYAYARAGFGKYWTTEELQKIPNVTPAVRQALHSNELQQLVHFRNLPLTDINDRLRRIVQPKFRASANDNWNDPYEMEFTFSPNETKLHLERIRKLLQRNLGGQVRAGKQVLTEIMQKISEAKVTPILVLLPEHPELANNFPDWEREFVDFITAMANEFQAPLYDARQVLQTEHYADALHPNAAGRQQYSADLGNWLKSQLPLIRKGR